MTMPRDDAGEIRAGEELDTAALSAYLTSHFPGAGPPVVRQFRQGHSNLTYLVAVGGREYVLRRPPFGHRIKSAHDMGREFRILSALAPVFPPAPRPLLSCDDASVLGAPFYLMERRLGTVVRRDLPAGFSADPAAAGRLCRTMVDALAALHAVDYRAVGLESIGKPDGYVARQVRGWAERYRAAETEPVPDMDAVASWLARHQPAEQAPAVIHNDFKFDNVMIASEDPGRIVAVLDWEMATVGDPLMDLGTMLAYWIEPDDPEPLRAVAMGPTAAPGMWTRRQVADAYAERTGRPLRDLGFYHTFGLFKLAVIIQQLHARYRRGDTADARFATMDRMVRILAAQAAVAAS